VQELYLARNPSKSELKIMNLTNLRQMTQWDSPTANAVEYFTAALIARLAISLKIEPPERVWDFMKLTFLAAAASQATFKVYMEALGAKVSTESDDTRPQKAPESKGNWISRMFK
jgi:hypothetical protein